MNGLTSFKMDDVTTFILVVVLVFIIGQFVFFISTLRKICFFKNIFPNNVKSYTNTIEPLINISTKHKNPTLSIILAAINDYLRSNKDTVSDFHILKDIVDRNCDSKEEEFYTQIPMPLYIGLGGTMLGIVIGVGYFILSGGINAILGSTTGSVSTTNPSDGIQALLGGVALAMISSFVGITLTTITSYYAKNSKVITEGNKHIFLSWIQTTLLPSFSTDSSGALVKMSQNLIAFNQTFSSNTSKLDSTLTKVNDTYVQQRELWDLVQKISDKDIQQVNIELMSMLNGSIEEIGKLGNYLKDINSYQANTTDAIDKMRKFFSLGIEQVDTINLGLKNALERFSENSDQYLNQLKEKQDSQVLNISNDTIIHQEVLQKAFNRMIESLSSGMKVQNDKMIEHFQKTSDLLEKASVNQLELFKLKMNELTLLVDELKSLSSVKTGISNLERATLDQNEKIDKLTKAIKQLAEIKTTGGVAKTEMPRWVKLSAIVGGTSVALTCLYFIAVNALSLVGIIQ